MDRRLLWVSALFFFSLRFFTNTSEYYIGFGDEAGFLQLAKRFPAHKLFDDSLYLIHPPLQFYVLRFLFLFTEPHRAGIFLSLACSAALWFIAFGLHRLFQIKPAASAAGLICFALPNFCISQQSTISREPFYVMMLWAAVYFFLKGLRADQKYFVPAALFAVATAWTADFVVLLFPAFLLAWVFFGTKEQRARVIGVCVACLAAYMVWVSVRAYEYSHHTYLPVGIDGTIERTNPFPPASLYNPNFFPITQKYARVFEPAPFFRLGNGEALVLNPFWNHPVLLSGVLLFLVILANIRAWQRQGWRNFVLYFTMLTGMLSGLIFLGQWPRYGIMGMVSLSVVLAQGFSEVFELTKKWNVQKYSEYGMLCGCLLLSAAWILGHRIPVLAASLKIEGQKLSSQLMELPGNTIMAPVGLTEEIAYLTGKQVVAMPFTSSSLQDLVHRFKIRYLILSKKKLDGMSPEMLWACGAETMDRIKSSPQLYRKLGESRNLLQVSLNWHQIVSWNPRKPPPIGPADVLLPEEYDIYEVIQ